MVDHGDGAASTRRGDSGLTVSPRREPEGRLRPDPKLPFLEMAWSRRKSRAFFSQYVVPALFPGQEIAGFRRKHVRYRVGQECVIQYQLRLGETAKGPPRLTTATFASDSLVETFRSRWSDAPAEGVGGTEGAGRVYVPEYACLVEAFPTDWRLPALRQAMEPRKMEAWLTDAMAAPGGGTASIKIRGVRVLRYRPGRTCVLRYVLQGSENGVPSQVIGKVYPEGPKSAEVWQKMDALHALGGDAGITFPRPLAQRDGLALIVMERVPGTDLDGILDGSTAEREAKEGVRAAASALASLHNLTLETQESRSLEGELDRLRRRAHRLHSTAPQLARNVEALLGEISQFDLGLSREGRCLIHGDYKPRQLLLDADRVAVVDLDRACLGDPAIDVGSFMAVLHKKALLQHQKHLGRLAPLFLEHYQACSPRSGLADRARLFQAMILLRMVVGGFERSPRSYRRKGAGWPHLSLLDDAAACLKAVRPRR